MKTLLFTICLVIIVCPCRGATTNIIWFNSQETLLRDFNSVPLFSGIPGFAEGDILQLGYYSLATSSNPFNGEWVSITNATIGGKLAEAQFPGRYSYDDGYSVGNLMLGVPLSVRFYDSPSVTTATYWNAVSNTTGDWNLINSDEERLTMTLSLADSTLVWQDSPGSAFRTTIPIPEPGEVILMAGTMLVLSWRRKRPNSSV